VKLVGVRPPVDRDWPFTPAQPDGSEGGFRADVPLVPYHSWAERGSSTMRIWIPTAPAT
jgi:uncharacterized protein